MANISQQQNPRKVARTLAFLMFGFMCIVSAVILFSDDNLGVVGYILVFAAPPVLGVLGYYVGLHHDESASD